MSSDEAAVPSDQSDILTQILSSLQSIQQNYGQLAAAIDSVQGQVNILARVNQIHDAAGKRPAPQSAAPSTASRTSYGQYKETPSSSEKDLAPSHASQTEDLHGTGPNREPSSPRKKSGATITSRIILTTYPNQSGIDPLIMNWGHENQLQRGPVVVSRSQSTLRRRNGM